MTNHPNRGRRSYWLDNMRGFANEFCICIATTKFDAENYAAKGYQRITRATAARMSAARYISAIDQDYRSYEIDHGTYNPGYWSPSFAALCRSGGEIDLRDVGRPLYA